MCHYGRIPAQQLVSDVKENQRILATRTSSRSQTFPQVLAGQVRISRDFNVHIIWDAATDISALSN